MRKHRFLAVLLAVVMLLGMFPSALAAGDKVLLDPEAISYPSGITLDKDAGGFTTGRRTSITLSLTAPENKAPIAIEFVLDCTQSLMVDEQTGLPFITSCASAVAESFADKNVYVGVTGFSNDAAELYAMQQFDAEAAETLETETFRNAVAALIGKTGTNVQAGIRAGLASLAEGAEAAGIPAERRYLVLITDGGSFWWLDGAGNPANASANGVPMQNNDAAELCIGGHGDALAADFDALMAAADMDAAPAAYTSTDGEALADVLNQIAANGDYTNFEKGVYYAAKELDTLAGQANLITVGFPYYRQDERLDPLTTLAGGFVGYAVEQSLDSSFIASSKDEVAGQIATIMDGIYSESQVIVPAGSTVTDFLGYETEPEAYNFNLETSQSITLTVKKNGQQIGFDAQKLPADGSNKLAFQTAEGAPIYELEYFPAEDGTERLVLTLGDDISRDDIVTLTYTARLASRDTSRGRHYVDPNVTAYLTPAGTDEPLLFPVPTLSYYIGGGTTPTDPPIDILDPETPLAPLPELNTEDHYAYIIGRDDGLSHPEASITRAEVATIFFRMLTEESRNQLWTTTNPYSDVAPENWYNNAVSTLTGSGVITGKPGNLFDPDASITRAEFATIAVRFFGGEYEGDDLFTDIAGHWANKYINRAAILGLINGKGDGTFDPNANITRAEAMAIMNRTLGRKPNADHMLPNMITWEDNLDASKWYYADVQEATNSHDFDVATEGAEQYEVWTALLPVRDWAALEREWSESNSSSNPGDVVSGLHPGTESEPETPIE